jgi:anti-sigma B factor antagonist
MEITDFTLADRVRLVSLDGEMDLYNASDLKDRVASILQDGAKNLVLDLDKLEYIDSSGISALLYTYTQCRSRSVKLFFINVKGSVRKVIELTSLIGFFPIADNINDALQRFGVRQGS